MKEENKYTIKDSGKRVNYESGFTRDVNENKPRYDLIPFGPLRRLAMHFTNGAIKYGDCNWQLATTDPEIHRFKESALRHMFQWSDGQDDEDHASAAIWNIMAYEYHTKHKSNENESDKKK